MQEKKIWEKINFCEKICSILSYRKNWKLVATAVNEGAVNQRAPAPTDYKSSHQHL